MRVGKIRIFGGVSYLGKIHEYAARLLGTLESVEDAIRSRCQSQAAVVSS